jgi:hypothetical protein
LRTLLAYLDDTLEPAQAKLIGQKVAESETAQELIARIKQVTRRRRLTIPPQIGPGARLDPNIIAEYLDNALSAEQIADVEEICLDSDVHLAEVAACHQILTLVLGEPARVPPTARQRMYRLAKGRESIPNRKVAALPVGAAPLDGTGSGHDEIDEALLLGLPLYRREGGIARWRVPVAAICLVAAGIAIWMALRNGFQPVPTAPTPVEDRQLLVAKADEKAPPEPVELQPKGPAVEPPPPDPGALPETKPDLLPSPKPDLDAKGASGTPPDAGAPKKPEPAPKPAAPAQIQPPSTERREVGKYSQMVPSVLLYRTRAADAWKRLKLQSKVYTSDYLVSLPGYRSELDLDSGVHLLLWGNLPEFSRVPVMESAVTLHANPAVDLDFTLDRGRVVISNHKKEGPAHIRLRFLDEVWEVTLPDQVTEVALELGGVCLPYNKEPGGGEPGIDLNFITLRGQAGLRIRYEEYELPSPSLFTWDNSTGPTRGHRPLPRAPEWWANRVLPRSPMSAAMEGLTNRLTSNDKIDVALAETLNKTDAPSRSLALRCLGATEELSTLLDALADDRQSDVRILAIDVFRHLLGLGRKNDEKLHKILLQKNYTEGQARTILQLLHGFSEQQWSDPAVRVAVVENLNHEKLAIRQLTHTLLLSLVPAGQRITYDAAASADQRDRGSKEWEKLVLGGRPGK